MNSHPPFQELPAAASWLSQHLHVQLAERESPACHLLFDPAPRPLQPDEPLAQVVHSALEQAGSCRASVRYSERAIVAAQHPSIYTLDSSLSRGSHAIASSIELALAEAQPQALVQGRGRRIGGWLTSSSPPEAIAAHLARHSVHRHPDGSRRLLRLADPAVMWWLWAIFTPRQRVTLHGPIEQWHLLDPTCGLVALFADPQQGNTLTDLALMPAQWSDIDRIGALNAAMLQWRLAGAQGPVRAIADASLSALHAGRRANAHGLSARQDIARFVLHALTHHPAIDAHPKLQPVLQQCRAGEQYCAAAEQLAEADWQTIAAELGAA